MTLGGCPQQYVVDPGPSPVLRVFGYPDALGDLIRGGEAYAVDLLCQGVGILLHRLDGQIPVGLINANRSPGTDPVAMQEDHDLADLHPLVPGIGDPFPAFWPDTIDGLQVSGIVSDNFQYPGAEVSEI